MTPITLASHAVCNSAIYTACHHHNVE